MSDNEPPLPEWLKYAIEWAIFLPLRLKCRFIYMREFRACMSAIAQVRELGRKNRALSMTVKRDMARTKQVIDLSLYLLLISYDLLEFKRDIQLAVGRPRRGFVARHLALLLHEMSEELPKLIGRPYRESLGVLGVSEQAVAQLDAIGSDLSAFRRGHQEFLSLIRNLVVAHREHDAHIQLEVMDTLDPLEVLRCGAELSRPLNRLVQFQTEVTAAGLGMEGLLREMLSKSPPPASKESKAKVKWRRIRGG